MSLLTEFAKSAFTIAGDIIGRESLTIGSGPSIGGVMNEATFSREYESGGFEQSSAVDFVTGITEFVAAYPLTAKSYEGKVATARGDTWRIVSIRPGASFVSISLSSTNKSS